MQFIRVNKAIRDHRKNDRKIFLFKESKETFIKLEAELNFVDYEYVQTIDREGNNRKAIQFRLKSIESKTSPISSKNHKTLTETYAPPQSNREKRISNIESWSR